MKHHKIDTDRTILNPLVVSMVRPLEVPVSRQVLLNILDDVISNLERNRVRETESATEREELDSLVAQRIQFRAWVQDQQIPEISIAMYPLDASDQPLFSDFGPMLLA